MKGSAMMVWWMRSRWTLVGNWATGRYSEDSLSTCLNCQPSLRGVTVRGAIVKVGVVWLWKSWAKRGARLGGSRLVFCGTCDRELSVCLSRTLRAVELVRSMGKRMG